MILDVSCGLSRMNIVFEISYYMDSCCIENGSDNEPINKFTDEYTAAS